MHLLRLPILTAALLLAALPAQAFECSGDEVGYFATLKTPADKAAELESLLAKLTEEVRAREPGAVFYAPYKGEEPGVYHFMERYENEAARSTHASAGEIRAIFGQLIPLLEEPLEVVRVSALCP